MKHWLEHLRHLAFLLLPLAALVGCSSDEEEPAPTPATVEKSEPKQEPKKPDEPEKIDEPEVVEEVLKPSLNLTLDAEIKSELCIATLKLGVLQVSNYAIGKSEVFPSVFLQAKPGADKFKALEGNTIDAQVFVQKTVESVPLHVSDGATAKLKITKVTDTFIVGVISETTIFDIESGSNIPLKCKFVAEIK